MLLDKNTKYNQGASCCFGLWTLVRRQLTALTYAGRFDNSRRSAVAIRMLIGKSKSRNAKMLIEYAMKVNVTKWYVDEASLVGRNTLEASRLGFSVPLPRLHAILPMNYIVLILESPHCPSVTLKTMDLYIRLIRMILRVRSIKKSQEMVQSELVRRTSDIILEI